MDAYLALVSKREVREYAGRPIPEQAARRILDAGRLAGSANNRQPWRFLVLDDRAALERVAETVYVPRNLLGAALVVAIAVSGKGPVAFDAGRAAQNMVLAAWSEGIGSCPNGMPDSQRTAEALGLDPDWQPVIVLSFGYPARPRDPDARSPEEWIRRADRKPLEEVARHL